MVKDSGIRLQVHGRTITESYDWLLDRNIKQSQVMKEAAKQLEKVIFSHPSVALPVRPIIRSLREEA